MPLAKKEYELRPCKYCGADIPGTRPDGNRVPPSHYAKLLSCHKKECRSKAKSEGGVKSNISRRGIKRPPRKKGFCLVCRGKVSGDRKTLCSDVCSDIYHTHKSSQWAKVHETYHTIQKAWLTFITGKAA